MNFFNWIGSLFKKNTRPVASQPVKTEKPRMKFLVIACLFLSGCASQWPDVTLKEPQVMLIGMTGSMKPHFNGGELARVVPMKWEDLRPGMICVYWNRQLRRDGTVCHRIMFKKGASHFVMKGDNNFFNDPGYMTPLDYVGTIVEN